MLTLHCLAYSRAIRVAWLLEDLGQPYDLVTYDRTADFRAPEALRHVHPLGKSPVIQDGDLLLAESSACLRYIVDTYGTGAHRPPRDSVDRIRHEEMLDYVESSFAGVAMGVLLPALQSKEPSEGARKRLDTHLAYIAGNLTPDALLFGTDVTLADIQFSYLLANLSRMGFLESAPRIEAYWAALQTQPGYKAAVEKTGPMAPEA
ncbi:glutathione S-transferase [Limimaricola sp. G21655-S1]|uniref:glutathione S-transferase family protein n=1 Tax=Limimaricola sp. G21655-S1 TaxID=3014768 RepID=UPI0022AE6FDB|nr:glutathione S-transferase [Limimaricola sp. G21655-S1]MCZ4262547.1 glutathione S-transferase [Limimaricola sp. G21655-S1]